ncbi:MAG: UDP-N-acetylmuramate dehydrogenase [Acidobacteriales bacterium]|nr:UDP-N-acetylmuramate dehydrogenase [Terriglobales bacterium]
MIIQENVPLARLTTLGVGGQAQYLVEAVSAPEVKEAVAFAHKRQLKLFVLGGGSNVVISDSGWPGVVLKVAIAETDQSTQDGKRIYEVGAGASWDKFVELAVANNCAGVECMSGIPGSVGGTPVQNVGAYGQEVSQTIESVQALDLRDGEIRELCHAACGFGYRTSIFNTTEYGRYVVLKVRYALTPGGEAHIDYADLKKYFAGWRKTPTLAEVRDAVLKTRASKGMLIIPGDDDCRSAGSFFKNPILSEEEHLELMNRAREKNLDVPSFPAGNRRKVSAAWLVEHSGFSKGYNNGRVGISGKHALAIVNRGGATAGDVLKLKDEIQRRVQDIWNVKLIPEPVFVGFDAV